MSLEASGMEKTGCNSFKKDLFKPQKNKPNKIHELFSKDTEVGFIALVQRGSCRFDQKVRAMQKSGAIAVIVGNTENELIKMYSSDDTSDIYIPSVSTTLDSYKELVILAKNNQEKPPMIKIYPNIIDWPLLDVVLITLLSPVILMLIILFVWQINQRRMQRKRLATPKMMQKLKTSTAKSDILEDKCPICLEYYVLEEQIRTLPCRHFYHTQCIDQWLTKINKICPMCKSDICVNETTPLVQRNTETTPIRNVF